MRLAAFGVGPSLQLKLTVSEVTQQLEYHVF